MKKLVFFAAVAATVFFFNSCSKDDPATAVSTDIFTDKATIEGVAYVANTDNYVPEGTKLSFSIAYSALGVVGSSGNSVTTTTVGANGAYSVELPARADGNSVTVTISSEDFIFNLEQGNGYKKSEVFSLTTTQSIVAGLKYEKVLRYTFNGGLISESAKWTSGTWKATFKYHNGVEEVAVPAGTEVRITIAANKFVPAKLNNVILVQQVGADGSFTFTYDAPTLLENGLSFDYKWSFDAEYVTDIVKDTKKIVNFTRNSSSTIYGGTTVDQRVLTHNSSGDLVGEPDVVYTEKGTYKVVLKYTTTDWVNGASQQAQPVVPEGTKVKVTISGYAPYAGGAYVFTTTVGANGLVTVEALAPSVLDTPNAIPFTAEPEKFMATFNNDGQSKVATVDPSSFYGTLTGGRTIEAASDLIIGTAFVLP